MTGQTVVFKSHWAAVLDLLQPHDICHLEIGWVKLSSPGSRKYTHKHTIQTERTIYFQGSELAKVVNHHLKPLPSISLPTKLQSLGCGPASGSSVRIYRLQVPGWEPLHKTPPGGPGGTRAYTYLQGKLLHLSTGQGGWTWDHPEKNGGFFLFQIRKGTWKLLSLMLLYDVLLWIAHVGTWKLEKCQADICKLLMQM